VGAQLAAPIVFEPRLMKLEVDPAGILEVAQVVRDAPELDCNLLTLVSGVDMGDHIAVVYHLHSLGNGLSVQMRVRLDRDNPVVDSLVSLWPAANWLERETYDLVGVQFAGHPDPRRIMLDDDFVGHPLRKDFLPPAYRNRGRGE
jgi:NADH/F420H2 dehydrogenase subunit C